MITEIVITVLVLLSFGLYIYTEFLRSSVSTAHRTLHAIQTETRAAFLSDDFCQRQSILQRIDRHVRDGLFYTRGPAIAEINSLSHLPYGSEEQMKPRFTSYELTIKGVVSTRSSKDGQPFHLEAHVFESATRVIGIKASGSQTTLKDRKEVEA